MRLHRLILFAMSMAVMVCAFTPEAASAAEPPLIMSLKSNIYGYQGPTNSFTIYLGSTESDTEFYVEGPKSSEYVYVDPYSFGSDEEGNNVAVATAVTLSVSERDNEIKIYGDASKLDYIDVHGCYLSSLEFYGNFLNLSVLDASHNELSRIDLSDIPSLNSIDLLDNEFTVGANMKIGTNHPGLMILSVGINAACDPELDLRNFPELVYFNAYSNQGLTSVDPSQCPNLISLQLDATNISSIDVSKNAALTVLNLSQTKISQVDLSKNVALTQFYLNHDGTFNALDEYKVKTIDLSKNVNLQYLDLGGNLLTEIDLSHNTRLMMLYLMRNFITHLDLDPLQNLVNVDISNNCMNFANLPLPRYNWDYTYYQRPLPCDLKYKVGDPIDFSSMVIRAPFVDNSGITVTPETFVSVMVAPRAQEPYVLEPSKYSFEKGVLTFKEAVADSVYAVFYNSVFDEWSLRSTNFMVNTSEQFELPSVAFTFTPQSPMAGQKINFRMGASPVASGFSLPADVIVRMGDETIILEDAVTQSSMPSGNNISLTLPAVNGPVEVCLADGFALTSLGMKNILLTEINLDPSDLLEDLVIENATLPFISLGYNRELTHLQLTGNILTSVNLAGVRGDYEKWMLSDIDLSDNRLTEINVVSYETIHSLNLSGNQFTTFDPGYYTGLTSLDLSGNMLSGELDLTGLDRLTTLDVSGNNYYSVLASDWSRFTALDLSDNDLSFATLPRIKNDAVKYSYAPQNKIRILGVSSGVDLSAQNIMTDGSSTSYVWKYASDGNVVPAEYYTANNGAFIFDDALMDLTLYCEMTNPAFPDFDKTPLTTTNVLVAAAPTTLVASFTPSESCNAEIGFRFNTPGDNAVYIDWKGDGSELEPYVYEANASGGIYRTGRAYAGKTAKVYTFGSAADVSVFALNNTPLSDFDGTPMTGVEAIDIHSAGLRDGSIKLPQSSRLTELVLDGSNFSTESFTEFENLSNLNLSANNYETFDLGGYKSLRFVALSSNGLTSIDFGGNTSLFQVIAENNHLTEVDLTGLTGLEELLLNNNDLASIDLSPVSSTIRALMLAGNKFTFTTLPLPDKIGPELSYYDYANQQPLAVTPAGATIDLSSQAMVEGQPTIYRWFLGNKSSDVYYDYYEEVFVGDELTGPDVSDDPDFTIENGITTFCYQPSKMVICAMTNPQLPSLILYTLPAAVDVTSVENVEIDGEELVDVYSFSGILLHRSVSAEEALKNLAPGLYIIGNKKVMVK